MKFTKNRLLSLLLVLAMLFALATTAFAGNEGSGESGGSEPAAPTPTGITLKEKDVEGTVSGNVTLHYGETKNYVAVVTGSDGNPMTSATVNWTLSDGGSTYLDLNQSTGTVTAKAITSTPVTLTATVADTQLSATVNISVTAKAITLPSGSTSVTATVSGNTEKQTYTQEGEVKDELTKAFNKKIESLTAGEKDALAPLEWTFDSASNTGKTFNSESKKEGGTLVYKATVTLKESVTNYTLTSTAITGTVTFKAVPTIGTIATKVNDVAGSTLRVVKGATTGLKLSVDSPTKTPDGAVLSYQWYKCNSNGTYTESSSNVLGTSQSYTVPTTQSGTYYYVCKVTATNSPVYTTKDSAVFTVTVTEPYRVKVSRTYTGTNTVGQVAAYSATLEKYTGASTNDGYAAAEYGTGKDYTSFVIATDTPKVAYNSGSAISINGSTFYLNMYSAGTTSLTATMYQSSTATTSIPVVNGSISVSAAEVSNISMNPTTSSYALIDTTTLLSAIYSATNSSSLSKYITTSSIVFNGNGYGTFSTTGSSGSSSYTFTNTSYASSFYFVPSSSYTGFTSPNMYITYTAYSSDGTIATGKIYFTSASSITYSTTASTPVYFKASDFSDYFKTALGGTYNSSYYTLSEVTFGTPRVSNSSVTSGTLYYNNGYVYSTTKVPAANLGYVSYTPSSSTYTYTVSIPFTAYGTYYYGSTATKTVSGTVTIKVNDGHVITMVGTDFKTASIWSDITSKHPGVSYVSFSQPQSTVGKLYYGYSSIASKGSLVSYTDRFNNSNYNYSYANTIKSIDGIYFVPAAGCLDTVTLTYTAYTSATATTGVSDTITFTITKKTASSIFNDVTASNTGKWSADAIDFLARNSIVEGGSYGTFNPNGNMTRGDFVLMLYRMAGKPSVSGISNPFTDVKSTDYYYNAILWAYRNDIVTGVDAKTFAPKKNITREQIAATLYRMAGSPSTSGYLTGYYDYAKIHSYATNAMRWAISNGVITGSNGYLTPTNNATRAQVATMLHRYLTK